MKGVRFYLEYKDAKHKRQGVHEGNVIAVLDVMGDGFRAQYMGDLQYTHECLGAIFFYPNSPVAGTQCHIGVLRERCKRISEAKARQIHPRLFERLDSDLKFEAEMEREERGA